MDGRSSSHSQEQLSHLEKNSLFRGEKYYSSGVTFAHVFASVLCVLLAEGFSLGTPVQDQFSLDQLAAQADFVFKGTVISSLPDANPNAGDQRTSFKVVSVIKGSTPSTTCVLLHLDSLTQDLSRLREEYGQARSLPPALGAA
jgi:hypothetical protein